MSNDKEWFGKLTRLEDTKLMYKNEGFKGQKVDLEPSYHYTGTFYHDNHTTWFEVQNVNGSTSFTNAFPDVVLPAKVYQYLFSYDGESIVVDNLTDEGVAFDFTTDKWLELMFSKVTDSNKFSILQLEELSYLEDTMFISLFTRV